MMLFTRHLKLTVALVCGLALCAHGAQAPQHININQLSTTVEDVVHPGGSGDDANKKEVRDLCRAAVLLRFGY